MKHFQRILILISLLASQSGFSQVNSVDKAFNTSANLLENPGFENGASKWTASGSGGTISTSGPTVGFGSTALRLSTTTSGNYVESALYSVPSAFANQPCLAQIYSITSATTYLLKVIDGSAVELVSGSIPSSTSYVKTALAFPCPSSGTMKLKVVTSETASRTIDLDQGLLGGSFLDMATSINPVVYIKTDTKTNLGATGTLTHSLGIAPANQEWVAFATLATGGANLQLDNGWITGTTSNAVSYDFSGFAGADVITVKLKNLGVTASSLPNGTFDTGELSSAPSTTIPHGLGAVPTAIEIQQEGVSIAGKWDNLKVDDYCSADATNLLCTWTPLTIDGTHRLRIVASRAPLATAIDTATTSRSGIVSTSAQSFGGAKSFDSDVTVDTDVLKVDTANNRVGINTAAPAAALQVGTGSPTTAAAGIQIGSTGNPPQIYRADNERLSVDRAVSGGDLRFLITNTGTGSQLAETASISLMPAPNGPGAHPSIFGVPLNDFSSNPNGRDAGFEFYNLTNDGGVLVGKIGHGVGGVGGTTDDQLWDIGKVGETGSHTINGRLVISAQPCAAAYHNTGATYSTSNTVIAYNTERFDRAGNFSSNTFTAPVAGRYLVSVGVTIDALSGVTSPYIDLRKNGSFYDRASYPNATANARIDINDIVELAVSDTIDTTIRWDSGTSVTLGGSLTNISICLLN